MSNATDPIRTALQGKGLAKLVRRGAGIAVRYGLTPARMNRALSQLVDVLHRHGCGATLPITAVALQRAPGSLRGYQSEGIEFAVHGLRHIDYSRLPQEEQRAQLVTAWRILEDSGIRARGFRGPYLRRSDATLVALRDLRFSYDATDSLAWDVVDGDPALAYAHVLRFYGTRPAAGYTSLPRLDDGLVRIPYSLPDDEALVERLQIETTERQSSVWLAILERTYELGELFALGLHPERTALCLEALDTVLGTARSFRPSVWIARLDEIADWWRTRAATVVRTEQVMSGAYRCSVQGPPGTTVLIRNAEVDATTTPWVGPDRLVDSQTFTVQAPLRPWIGVSPGTPTSLDHLLGEQGYITERAERPGLHACYLDQPEFRIEDERALLSQLARSTEPLVRLGRWPDGARSALAITGDIDALTLWDYCLRIAGR